MKKILILLLVTITLFGYNNRCIIGTNPWSATDTNEIDSIIFTLDKSFDPQVFMFLFDIHDTIPSMPDTYDFELEDPDSFVFTLEGWVFGTATTYTKYTIFTDTCVIPADTFIFGDTILDWYVQMCDTFLLLQQTLNDTLGFEGDTTLVTPYLNRIR